jgi:UV DNA damage endonuclease
MRVRFGYVAMSTVVKNASPSKTMTMAAFSKIADREAAIRKLERIGAENLNNTLRLLKHNRAYHIHLYRLSSKLVPLMGHENLAEWDPLPMLSDSFAEVGAYAREHGMRLSFHPDHFTVLSTPRRDVLDKSYADLDRHVRMLELMGMDEQAKCNIHIGGSYSDKTKTMERFLRQFADLPPRIKNRLTLENDDKTFTAAETLEACEVLGVPMVLDIHHHAVNNNGEDAASLWPRIHATWNGQAVPPKIHTSSPKGEKDPRSHADYIHIPDLLPFLQSIAPTTEQLDVMIEAKMKDSALFQLMEQLLEIDSIQAEDDASVIIE